MAALVIGCHKRDLALSLELTADLAVQRLLVGFDRQQEVGPLLLELPKNGFWVWRASAPCKSIEPGVLSGHQWSVNLSSLARLFAESAFMMSAYFILFPIQGLSLISGISSPTTKVPLTTIRRSALSTPI
jgi:hypothetical protein